jgi:hypothetical protein
MVNIADDEWIVDLAAQKCRNVVYNFIVKFDYHNHTLSGKITNIPQNVKKMKLAKKEKALYLQLKILQAGNVYFEAVRKAHNNSGNARSENN